MSRELTTHIWLHNDYLKHLRERQRTTCFICQLFFPLSSLVFYFCCPRIIEHFFHFLRFLTLVYRLKIALNDKPVEFSFTIASPLYAMSFSDLSSSASAVPPLDDSYHALCAMFMKIPKLLCLSATTDVIGDWTVQKNWNTILHDEEMHSISKISMRRSENASNDGRQLKNNSAKIDFALHGILISLEIEQMVAPGVRCFKNAMVALDLSL